MNIYIDCEWNGTGGKLISMALCAANGAEFYEVLGCSDPVAWVADHVMPVLNKGSISKCEFQRSLCKFLNRFESINIISDWPEDIARFCDSLITGDGTRLDTPPLTMQIFRVDTDSTIPHNALHDARGILKHFEWCRI